MKRIWVLDMERNHEKIEKEITRLKRESRRLFKYSYRQRTRFIVGASRSGEIGQIGIYQCIKEEK